MPLEIACFSVESAIAAHKAGASRIELCANPDLGGTTPSLEDLLAVKSAVGGTPVHVMIRPRGGDFWYDGNELYQIRQDIYALRKHADGFVFGILQCHNQENLFDEGLDLTEMAAKGITADEVDETNNKYFVGNGKVDFHIGQHEDLQRNFTFHRAFDEVSDWKAGLLALKNCGFNAVLVSGKKDGKAHENTTRLRKMVDFSREQDLGIDVIVGGSVRSTNLMQLVKETGATWYHSSALVDDTGAASFEEMRKMIHILNAV